MWECPDSRRTNIDANVASANSSLDAKAIIACEQPASSRVSIRNVESLARVVFV